MRFPHPDRLKAEAAELRRLAGVLEAMTEVDADLVKAVSDAAEGVGNRLYGFWDEQTDAVFAVQDAYWEGR